MMCPERKVTNTSITLGNDKEFSLWDFISLHSLQGKNKIATKSKVLIFKLYLNISLYPILFLATLYTSILCLTFSSNMTLKSS